jgi:hypothetical protein
MCNCLFFALWMRFRWGGTIRWHRSRTWLGFHNTWVSPNGKVLEYTLVRPKRQPWWYIPICYRGVVKELL